MRPMLRITPDIPLGTILVTSDIQIGTKTSRVSIPILDFDYTEAIKATSLDIVPEIDLVKAYAVRQAIARHIGYTIEESIQQLLKDNQ